MRKRYLALLLVFVTFFAAPVFDAPLFKAAAAATAVEDDTKSEIRILISEIGRLRRDVYQMMVELLEFGLEPSDLADFYELDEALGSIIPILEDLDALGYVPEEPDEFDGFWELVEYGDETLDWLRDELEAANIEIAQYKEPEPEKTQVKPANPNNTATQSAYNKIIALKKSYPEGMPWTNANYYDWKGGFYDRGYGCAGFAFLVSDTVFGKNVKAKKHTDFDKVRVGDIIRMDNDSHSVVVLSVKGSVVTLVEGNYDASIHWGREITKQQLWDRGDYILTRY